MNNFKLISKKSISVVLMKKNLLRVMTIILIILGIAVNIVYSDAPFTLSIEPEEQEVDVGDTVTYEILVEVEEGFNESIEFELVASVLTWSETFDLGVLDPPYPFEFTYSFEVPEEIPVGGTGTAIITGVSGGESVQETVTLTIKTPSGINIPGFPIESIILGGASVIVILMLIKRPNPTIVA
jgi:hypothetical protein